MARILKDLTVLAAHPTFIC